MTRSEEITKDIVKLDRYIQMSDDKREIKALKKLIIILECWKES